MKPVLIVEGKPHEVRAINFFEGNAHDVMVSNGKTLVTYYNEKYAQHYVEKPLNVNFDECLKWVGQYDEIYQTFDKLIEDNQKEIQNLATEIADSVLPFSFPEQVKEREKLKQRTLGLMDAQDIIHEFMVEDVDLSGGEEFENM